MNQPPTMVVRQLFTIYIAQALHPVIVSVEPGVDLIEQWQAGVKEREKSGKWWQPIEFKDIDGTLIVLFATSAIAGIMRGGTQETPKIANTKPSVP